MYIVGVSQENDSMRKLCFL